MPTIGDLFAASRTILNDNLTAAGPVRYSDGEMMQAFNQAMLEARARRPDAFLAMGLRIAVPMYRTPDDLVASFPLDQQFYPLFIYYVTGWCELREDESASEARAVAYINRFTTGLITLANLPVQQQGGG